MSAPRDYVALVAAPSPDGAAALTELVSRMDAEPGWTRAFATSRLAVWTRSDAPLAVRAFGAQGVLLGEVLGGSRRIEGSGCETPRDAARRLLRQAWGRYLTVAATQDGAEVFRDPSGGLDALTWSLREPVAVAASNLMLSPPWLRPPRLRLHWGRISAFLAQPIAMSATPLFTGLEVVAPGELRQVREQGAVELLWRPADFIPDDCALDLDAARRTLRTRVDACVGRLTESHSGLLVELSGGLDSAIVAGAMGETGTAARVRQWVNRVGERAEGDERAYARQVTDRLGARLTAVDKPITPLEPADFTELAACDWPAINGADAARDRDMAARLDETGATGIVSGQGGDAVFYQMPSPLVAADLLRRGGPRAVFSDPMVALARRARRSVWSLADEARRAERARGLPSLRSPLVTPLAVRLGETAAHPWVRASAGLPLAKQLQVRAIANAQLNRGDCRRRRCGELIFPLLAQPVVEACLSIPAPVLAAGERDRPFARAALQDHVPPAILARRSKGDLTAYFAKLVAASAPQLYPFLRDGCLADAGLIDRAGLAQAFDPAQLIAAPRPLEVLCAAAVEAWVRHWQGRAPDAPEAQRR